jgi:coproporphyrinogen III oxidase-like Fe-S oxidoreductase
MYFYALNPKTMAKEQSDKKDASREMNEKMKMLQLTMDKLEKDLWARHHYENG